MTWQTDRVNNHKTTIGTKIYYSATTDISSVFKYTYMCHVIDQAVGAVFEDNKSWWLQVEQWSWCYHLMSPHYLGWRNWVQLHVLVNCTELSVHICPYVTKF